MKNLALITAGVIFLVVALIHLFRLIHPFNLTIGHYEVPLWVNLIAFIVIGFLSLWMFYSLRQ